MQIGDKVRRMITCTASGGAQGLTQDYLEKHEGTVVYIHPLGRFFVAEFELALGRIRESYPMGKYAGYLRAG